MIKWIDWLGTVESSAAYAQSKFANAVFTRELAKRLAKEQILAITLHPGGILTNGAENLSKDVWIKYGAATHFTGLAWTQSCLVYLVLDPDRRNLPRRRH